MTQQRIRILNDATINQIAAGEVVENPACVIKELVENAIDAAASDIAVVTKAGGKSFISVADNGCGMEPDDVILSIERHATSKLRATDDLWKLTTLGFRGEALPSIASISKMTIHSAPLGNEGTILKAVGGKIESVHPLPRQKGTTVDVRSLFFNVPARKHFQKTLGADKVAIHKTLIKYILGHPHISFSWNDDGKDILLISKEDSFAARMEKVLGTEFLNHGFPLHLKEGALDLIGHISTPSFHYPNRSGQYLFINQRSVVCPFISDKILEGYGTRLSTHRFPLFVLQLSVPSLWIDVNVHPQKKEVRIREEEQLGPFILSAIHNTLERKEQKIGQPLSFTRNTTASLIDLDFTAAEQISSYAEEPTTDFFSSNRRFIGKIKNYIFFEEMEGIRVIDLSRALERIVFEEIYEREGRPEIQTLLIPLQITLAGKDIALLKEHVDFLNSKGIGLRHFGGNTFIIDAIPAVLEPNELQDLVIAYLEEGKWPKHLGTYLKKRRMTAELGIMLVDKLFRCQNPHFTPENKRIHVLLDPNHLEKLFA